MLDVESGPAASEIGWPVMLPSHHAIAPSSSRSKASTTLLCAATLLTTLTYLEDAVRCLTMWSEQLDFVARHSGLGRWLAGTMLLVISAIQISSPLMIVPISACPKMAKPVMAVCTAIVVSVLMQPFLFDQLTNYELLTLSLAQLGATSLVFTEAYQAALQGSQSSDRASDRASPVISCVQLAARGLLTVDLTLVFATRLLDIFDVVHHTGYVAAGLASTTYCLVLLGGLMVWLGFKTQPCACIMALAALTDAFYRYPFWRGGATADFFRFHFFQAMTPVGGLLLLAALGPGQLSVDVRYKKE
jgi:uncharacterized membrane protein YphA (DoxX/SURF4 family)